MGRWSGMGERAKVVAWLRREGHEDLARSIEGGEHLKRPAPTIPASEWLKQSNVGP